ncbi:Rieske 2Fe-2S domain-containing protein [Bradyrhizobium diazoefficiens]|uniref:Rieske 2Fe-2S domain-containing protein n=1 Tax=Bradyrhizobium diazoefficiens TaxID=1355477 RepID=UPI003597FA75
MRSQSGGSEVAGPPSFETAKNLRQKARSAGMHPDHWYAVEYARVVPVGRVVEVKFWDCSIALFRGDDGRLRALEDRCAHRHVRLSIGHVAGCALTCIYHGWSYDEQGRLVEVPHELFGRQFGDVKIRTYPVRERYGLIWLFPGRPGRADQTPLPEIPEIEGPSSWACVPIDFIWRAHHSMIVDNVSDFTHAYLHKRYRPFVDAKLTRCEMRANKVELSYDVVVGDGRFSKLFVDRKRVRTDRMDLAFEYPYQWSNTGDKIKHWCFLLPIDERTTRVFFLFYFDALKIPFAPLRIPRWVMEPFLAVANRLLIKPLLSEDGIAVEAEQQAYDKFSGGPAIEFNPAVQMFQKLIVRRWEEHLAQSARGHQNETEGVA